MKVVSVLSLMTFLIACGNGSNVNTNDAGHDGSAVADTVSGDSASGDVFEQNDATPTKGLPVLGNFSHTVANVKFEELLNQSNGLNIPRDLEFHPSKNELWVISRADPKDVSKAGKRRGMMTIISNPGTTSISAKNIASAIGGNHFFVEPSAFSFATNGFFATIHETSDATQSTTPDDFMGPTLWDSNPSVFNAGHAGHMDMLHNSPLGMGIVWDTMNTYWVFDGAHSSITRYAFKMDHGPGGEDHSDGQISRFASGEVKRVADVSSHLELDRTSGLLYIADTGNSRIATLDTKAGNVSGTLPFNQNYDGVTTFDVYAGVSTKTWIDGNAISPKLLRPSGLYLTPTVLYVTDNQSGTIFAFSRVDGSLIDWLETGISAGGLMGITGKDDTLYVVDAVAHRVIMISAK